MGAVVDDEDELLYGLHFFLSQIIFSSDIHTVFSLCELGRCILHIGISRVCGSGGG